MSSKQQVGNVGALWRASDVQRTADAAATADDRALEALLPPGSNLKTILPLNAAASAQLVVGKDTDGTLANGVVRVRPAHFIAATDANTIGLKARLGANLDSAVFGNNSSGSTRYDLLYATISYAPILSQSVRQKLVQGTQPVSATLTIENDMTITLGIVAGVASGNPLASLPADSGSGMIAVYNIGLAMVALPNLFAGGAINQASITPLWNAPALPPWIQAIGSPFGNGVDGNCVFDGTSTVLGFVPSGGVYNISRDIYCKNMTVTGASTVIKTNNYRVFVNGTLTTSGGAKIQNNGVAASGTTKGTALLAGTLLGGGDGGNGGANNGVTVANGSVGYGGQGGGASAGAGGTAIAPAAGFYAQSNVFNPATVGFVVGIASGVASLIALAGGGGGGGGGAGTGGGGGSGAGVMVVAARILALANATDIQAIGGAGANGGGSTGGGGGGGGGLIILAYGSKNALTFSGNANCPGGAAGTGTGGNGQAGLAGLFYEIPLA